MIRTYAGTIQPRSLSLSWICVYIQRIPCNDWRQDITRDFEAEHNSVRPHLEHRVNRVAFEREGHQRHVRLVHNVDLAGHNQKRNPRVASGQLSRW